MGAPVTAPDTPDAIRADLDGMVAAAGRARYMRRQLEAAAEIGVAMLAALDLPRLVTPDFVSLDRGALGNVLDLAIAALDEIDGDPDVEDGGDAEWSLGWTESGPRFCGGYEDREHDTADAEPSLASPERHPAAPVCFSGGPFTARGGDESQLRWAEGARHDGELVNEDGDDLDAGEHDTADHESYLGWPEDIAAVASGETWVLTADPDAEHDDVDLEGDPAVAAWVFGPSLRGVAHV